MLVQLSSQSHQAFGNHWTTKQIPAVAALAKHSAHVSNVAAVPWHKTSVVAAPALPVPRHVQASLPEALYTQLPH